MMIIMMINMLFMFMNHPMSMGLILIIQTIMVSITTGMIMKSFWLSYILLITMLSGMLVLFIYMSSIASNEKFSMNIGLWTMSLLMGGMGLLFLLIQNKMIIKNNYFKSEMMSLNLKDMIFINKMFNSENIMLTIMLVIYLFITMIASTQLINIYEGPMKMKHYV